MRFFTQTISNYVCQLIDNVLRTRNNGQSMILMVPALPEQAVVACADVLTSMISARNVKLTLKVAPVLTGTWRPENINIAKTHGWLVENGSLTSYRNQQVAQGEALHVTILVGTDKVTDSSSLEDFHSCDFETLWKKHLKCSFVTWTASWLQEYGIPDLTREELKSFDRLIKPIYEQGRGDLIQISSWLESLDFHYADGDLREIKKLLLQSFDAFSLPVFSRFALTRKNAQLGPYIEKASSFFNYTMFLDENARNKAIKAIAAILEDLQNPDAEDLKIPLEDDDVRGPYATGIDFMEGLNKYVVERSVEERDRLLKCDFVTILDKILKFRKAKEPKERTNPRKLSGSPVEVVLTAVWQSLYELCRKKNYSDEIIVESIIVVGEQFKHDLANDPEEDSETALDSTTYARNYLRRLVGGVDTILPSRLALKNSLGEEIPVEINLCKSDIACNHSKTAEPYLEFSVTLVFKDSVKPQKGKFAWRLPEHHSYRIAEAFIRQAGKLLDNDTAIYKLPVFHIPYYEEVMRASSDDELRRVLLHCIQDGRFEDIFVENLLHDDWLATEEELLRSLKKLALAYVNFARESASQGLLSGLLDATGRTKAWADLFQTYEEAFCVSIDDPRSACSPMLIRAFAIIAQREQSLGHTWFGSSFEPSELITVLHPALLEMLEAQVIFQISCFNSAVNSEFLNETPKKAFGLNTWRTYIDFSSLQSPLTSILCDENKILDANTRGKDLFHRIGKTANHDAPLSTRVLLSYGDDGSETGFSDTEMFRESNESLQLLRLILDYFRLHPHARDGLSLAIFRNNDIQPVIAAIHAYLTTLSDPKDSRYYLYNRQRPYAISVTFFTESCDDTDVTRWIDEWRQRWEASETEPKYQAYANCRFAVAHRLVERGNLPSFQRIIKDSLEADIAVFYGFINAGSGVNRFETVPPFNITTRTLKFPILEKACCSINNPADQYRRSRVISNRQFVLGEKHACLMHSIRNESTQTGTIVIGTGDFAPWRGVIDALHSKTEWVICIDPNMDDRLIKQPAIETQKTREVIGFGSGVGTHGEDNFTISTEQFSFADISARLTGSIQSLFSSVKWNQNECRSIAQGVLRVACRLSGLSLVRATGVDDQYIRDFMAYALVRKLVKADAGALCDNLISLDAYRHWFDLSSNKRRPDLMWLKARVGEDKRMHLEIHLIECKLGLESEELMVKARSQINNGLQVLMSAFSPVNTNKDSNMDDYHPERRYWWMQLHRLVASQAEIVRNQHANVLLALEKLAEGDFSLTWQASVFAFWTNGAQDGIRKAGSWQTGINSEVNGEVFFMRTNFIRDLAITEQNFPKTWAELNAITVTNATNVCDSLSEIDLPPGENDDDDPIEVIEIDEDDDEENFAVEPFIKPEIELIEEESDSSIELESDNTEIITEEKEIWEKPTEISAQAGSSASLPPQRLDLTSTEKVPTRQTISSVSLQGETNTAGGAEKILIGTAAKSDKKVYWEFGHEKLANRHLIIFGSSGYGKSYAIQCLLCEMARAGQNSLIIDYTDGFIPSKIEPAAKTCLKDAGQAFIAQEPLPINPFKLQESEEGGLLFKDNPTDVGKRIAAIFNNVYGLGLQQHSALVDAIIEGLEKYGEQFSLESMLEVLESYIDDGKHTKNSVQTAIGKLKHFVSGKPFSATEEGIGWEDIFSNNEIRSRIFQFYKVDRDSARAIIEFVLWDLYSYLSTKGNKKFPKVVVLDEIQNLDLSPDAPVAKYFAEGRKHGISLITATQSLKQIGGASSANMFQADMKLFFRPSEPEMKEHAQMLHNVIQDHSIADWIKRLSDLQKGECWALGRFMNYAKNELITQALKIRISSLEERGFHGQ